MTKRPLEQLARIGKSVELTGIFITAVKTKKDRRWVVNHLKRCLKKLEGLKWKR